MRNLVSLAVASILLLPAFGARADGSPSGDEAVPGSPGAEAVSASPHGEASPDRPVRAKPTVEISFDSIPGDGKPHEKFRVCFEWSDTVQGFTVSDIDLEGASTTGNLTTDVQCDGTTAVEGGTRDSIFTVEITTDEDLEGKIVVTVAAGAVTADGGDTNDETTAERVVDNRKPTLSGGTARERTIVLTYDERVDRNQNGSPQPAAFQVWIRKINGEVRRNELNPATVIAADARLTLTLPQNDTMIYAGDTVKVKYDPTQAGDGKSVRDSTGNIAAAFDTLDVQIENLRKINPPGPVENLTSVATDSSIALDWDMPKDTGGASITGYRIQGAKNNGNFVELRSGSTDTATAFLHKGNHAEGDIWEYVVSAKNIADYGDAVRLTDTVLTKKPGRVGDLVATAKGQTAIGLDWSAPDPGADAITGYDIESSPSGTGSWASVATKTDTATSYTHERLKADTTLWYRVRATNRHGDGPWSNVDSATTEAGKRPPGRPTGVDAAAVSRTAIDVTWTAPSDTGSSAITKYMIEVSSNGTRFDPLTDKGPTATSHRHSGLSAGTTRHYRVYAINATDTSAASDTAVATTPQPEPKAPSPPRSLEASAAGEKIINLKWLVPADSGSSAITGYKIEASKDDTASWRTLAGDWDPLTYQHSGLDPGDTWYYRVSATNGDDLTSEPSGIADATTDAAAPGAPKDLNASAVDSSQIDLTWNPPDDDGGSPIAGYRIQWSPNGTSGWDNLVRNTGDVTRYSDTTLDPNTTRHYRVYATNEARKEGPPSDVVKATTDAAPPGPPTGLQATPQNTSEVFLEWRAPDDDGGSEITGYRIEASEDRSNWTDRARTNDTGTNYTDGYPDAGDTVYYRVSAINSAGAGSPSGTVRAILFDVPGPPTVLKATPVDTSQIDLSWRAPSHTGGSAIQGYRIDASDDGGATWSVLVEHSGGVFTAYSHTKGLSPGDTRHYRVFAINRWGTGRESSNVAFATTEATVPRPPQNLGARADGRTRIALDWDPPADDGGSAITGYRIDFSADGGATWSTLESNTGRTITRYTDQGLDPGTTRHYRVAGINEKGAGEFSNIDGATTAPEEPGAPTDLSAAANGTAQIDLTWTAPDYDGGARVTGYKIEVSEDGASWRILRGDTNSDDTEFSHKGLRPGQTRHYRVSAINAAGTGEPSDTASATTDAIPPDPPTGLSADADGPNEIDLAWTPPAYDGGAPVTAYFIEVSRDGGSAWDTLVTTFTAAPRFTHTNLRPGSTRHYRVSAVNGAGTGRPSNEAHATTEAVRPDPPTDLEATADGISQIDLRWTAPVDDGGAPVTGYRIEVSVTKGATWNPVPLVANTGNAATTYSHTDLPPATRRDYRVRAVNRVGASLEPSNAAQATTDPDLPDPPTGLTASARGPRAIDLSWEEPEYKGGVSVTGYRIDVSEDGGSTWSTLVADTDSDGTRHTHSGLDPASTRHYRVYAINVAGTSRDPSNEAHATTDPIAPDAPTDLTAAADGTSRINLVWNAPEYDGGAPITGYRVEVSIDGGIVWSDLVENTGSSRTAYSHTGLNPATTRHYRVSAINRAGTGEPSNEADATTDATVPDPPTRLEAEGVDSARIDLSWRVPGFDGGAPITGYRIEVSEDGGNNWTDLAANTGSTATDHSHTGLRPATTRHYRVSAINEIGTGEPSEVAHATTDAVAPDPPTGLVAVAVSPTQIDLGWTAPAYDGGAPVTSYRIEVSEDGAAWADLVSSTGSAETRYSHVGLQPGSTRHYRVSAINAAGVGQPSAVASASTDDPVERAGRVNQTILPHFAGAAVTSTLGAISARIEAVAARNPLPSQLRAAGLASLVGRLRGGGSAARLLNGASFHMPVGGPQEQRGGEGFGAAAWGSAEYFGMGQPDGDEVQWDGGMMSLHLGADMRLHRDFLAGVSASRSSGSYDFTDVTGARDVAGTYEPSLNSVNPYVAWLPGRTGVALWAAGSFGWGEVAIDDEVAGPRSSDMRTTTGALGGARILVANGPSALRMRAEAWLSRLKVDDAPRMDSLTLSMQRARFILEWSQVHEFRSGDEVTVMLEGGARFGDGEGTEGAGMEFGGGMRYASPSAGLTMEGRGRLLVTGDSGYEEWGARGLIQVDPQAATGLSVRLVPAWGEPASGVQEMWDRGVSGRLDMAGGVNRGRLNAEVEYGLGGFHGTPYGRAHLVEGGGRAFGTGMRYEVGRMLDLRVEGTRTQGSGVPARHGLALRGHWRF